MKKLLVLAMVLALAAPAMAIVKTEIVGMDMVGPNLTGAGPATLTLDTRPARRSVGMVAGDGTDFPAESFFDVYVKVEIPGLTGTPFVIARGGPGVHMSAEIPALPPPELTEYHNQQDVEALLASDNAYDVALGVLLEAKHVAGGLVPDSTQEFEDGKIREYFENSEAVISISIPGPDGIDAVDVSFTGTYIIERNTQYYIPSVTGYGIAVLILLLLATGLFVVYRRRRGTVTA